MIFNLKDGVNPKVNLKVFLLNFLISLQLFILLQLIFIPGCPKIVAYHYYQLAAYLHVEANKLLPECQSGFREGHSTETLLLRLLSDIYEAVDSSQLTLLALFDVSAAFDTVDHKILLKRLKVSFDLSSNYLSVQSSVSAPVAWSMGTVDYHGSLPRMISSRVRCWVPFLSPGTPLR